MSRYVGAQIRRTLVPASRLVEIEQVRSEAREVRNDDRGGIERGNRENRASGYSVFEETRAKPAGFVFISLLQLSD
jgi:hypothetical protein